MNKECTIDGCRNKHESNGYCSKHRMRWYKYGDPYELGRGGGNLIERFEVKYAPEPMSGCWLWIGYCNRNGYGEFRYKGRSHLAHRISYLFHVGDFDESLSIMHKCDNPACVNPNHLRAGTMKDNMVDCSNKNRARNGNHKITEDEVPKIRCSPSTAGDLATHFGVTQGTIYRIRNYKTWKNIN